MLDLNRLHQDLLLAEQEAESHGLSKSLRDRIQAARHVLPVIESERDKRS